MPLIDRLLSVIAPHQCVGCGSEGWVLCPTCCQALPVVPSRCYRCSRATAQFRTCTSCQAATPLSQVFAATVYKDTAKAVLNQLKFERAQAAARDIAAALAAIVPTDQPWLITHIPTAPQRIRVRGYDQAEQIARALARQTGLPYAPLLARVNSTRQLGKNRATRQQQMQGAFRVVRPQLLRGKHVLLIDDVLTTGSTCEAAAWALKAAGAHRTSATVFVVA